MSLQTTFKGLGKENKVVWLKGISGKKRIGSISIPGTHDSGTYNLAGGLHKTQTLSIKEQLESGIRYLDIRLKIDNNTLKVFHSFSYTGLTFDDVLTQVCSFLESTPSEAVLMRIKEEGRKTGEAFENRFNFFITDKVYNQFFWKYQENNPTLDQVRRKIVIIQDFVSQVQYGPYLSYFKVQDNFNPKFPDRIEKKKTSIRESFFSAQKPGAEIVINHLSAVSLVPSILSPKTFADECNPFMRGLIYDNSPTYVGFVIADYPDFELVQDVIGTNEEIFNYRT